MSNYTYRRSCHSNHSLCIIERVTGDFLANLTDQDRVNLVRFFCTLESDKLSPGHRRQLRGFVHSIPPTTCRNDSVLSQLLRHTSAYPHYNNYYTLN